MFVYELSYFFANRFFCFRFVVDLCVFLFIYRSYHQRWNGQLMAVLVEISPHQTQRWSVVEGNYNNSHIDVFDRWTFLLPIFPLTVRDEEALARLQAHSVFRAFVWSSAIAIAVVLILCFVFVFSFVNTMMLFFLFRLSNCIGASWWRLHLCRSNKAIYFRFNFFLWKTIINHSYDWRQLFHNRIRLPASQWRWMNRRFLLINQLYTTILKREFITRT